MYVARAHLRETLEQLRFVGIPCLLPGRLPRLVCREPPSGMRVCPAELVILVQAQRIKVLERELALGLPRERPAKTIPGSLGFVPRLRGLARLAFRLFSVPRPGALIPGRHAAMLLAGLRPQALLQSAQHPLAGP